MEINYIAVIVSTILAMGLGAIWYGPIFGKQWMEIIGMDPNDKAAMEKCKKESGCAMLLQLLLTILQALVFAYLLDVVTLPTPYCLAFILWIGFVIPTLASSVMWTNESRKNKWHKFFIQTGFQFVTFLTFAIVFSYLG